ncbi:MAG TPA: cob(I)yrinic acid a,c-diamide adenosyltransferase [Thermoplasmata archaeon]|nr:cob(I)yrinic acid a,c-diamide adenosyltransferase [Thermoplasmata archaeon]
MSRPRPQLSAGRASWSTGGESIPRLYTRTGDHGTTGLAGGARVDKDSLRIRAYGAFDELGACLGLAASLLPEECREVRDEVRRLEHELFVAQSELATAPGGAGPKHRITRRHVERLEHDIDRFDALHPPLSTFVLATGATSAAALHVARTVARRAERELVTLNRAEPQPEELLAWANRLGDLLFALALATNHLLGVKETPPDYSA